MERRNDLITRKQYIDGSGDLRPILRFLSIDHELLIDPHSVDELVSILKKKGRLVGGLINDELKLRDLYRSFLLLDTLNDGIWISPAGHINDGKEYASEYKQRFRFCI